MNNALYVQFLALKAVGRKSEAKGVLNAFIASFQSDDERNEWVHAFLEQSEYGYFHRMRHEIYAELVFPVLLAGYNRQDAWSIYWLAGTAQNLYRCSELHAQVSYKTDLQLLHEVYAIDPSREVKRALLHVILRGFDYAQHEWPAGILCGVNGASIEECQEILQEIAFARTLDEGAYEALLQKFERRVREYESRLRNRALER